MNPQEIFAIVNNNPSWFIAAFVTVFVLATWLNKGKEMRWKDAVKATIGGLLISLLFCMLQIGYTRWFTPVPPSLGDSPVVDAPDVPYEDEPEEEAVMTFEDRLPVPPHAYSYNGHSYAIYNIEIEHLSTWSSAEQFCESLGGHLAVIDSQGENDAIYDMVLDSGLHLAFFGYTDEADEGNWTWVDGSSSGYENWADGQPNNGAANRNKKAEHYAEFSKQWTDGTWNDAPFGANTYHFVCEWDYE